ncbi:PKD domain-containing protein [Solicola sp. PLA-1-18]|uniref:PKD domain-containing protein n=1 Tax=Solicola sp. PLA-1-18 TaxID=3380532 RepID=UPI003B7EE341
MFSKSSSWRRGAAAATVSALLAGLGLAGLSPAAVADTAPDAGTPETVAADQLPTAQIDGVGWSQAIVGNTVYVGGKFTNVRPAGAAAGTNTTTRNNLMAYDVRTGVNIASFAPDLNGQVLAVAASPDGSRVYVGGDFTVANGQSRSRVAAYSTVTGQLISTFAPTASTQVRSITATNTTVYLGGNFQNVNGVTRTYAAAVSAADGQTLAWNPAPNAPVNALTLNKSGSKVVMGGRFDVLAGGQALGLGAVDPVTGAEVRWDTRNQIKSYGPGASINSLATDADGVYGTSYNFYGTGNLEGTFRADNETGALLWVDACMGDTYSVAPAKDVVYTASHKHYCENIGSFPETNPRSHYHAQAFTKQATGTVKPIGGFGDLFGLPSPTYTHWQPIFTTGKVTGQGQAGWSVATSANDDYVTYAGEFPAVNNNAQAGLVRFAKKSIAPNKRGPNANDGLTPTVIAQGSKAVRVSWQSTYDPDNENLTYKVYRNFKSTADTPVYTVTSKSAIWKRPQIGFIDKTAVPGATYNYRVYVSDPFGNTTSRGATIIDVPASSDTSAYQDAVQADEPKAYYRLGEPSGATAYDYAGFNDATAGAGVSRGTAGAVGDTDKASSFNGTDTGFAASKDVQQAPNTFTTEGWFRTTSTSGGKVLGFGCSATGNSGCYDRQVYLDNEGRVFFGVYPNYVATLNSSAGYNDGQWHQFQASLGSDGMKLYLDGKRVAARGDVTSGQDYSGVWRIGGDNLGGWPNQPGSYYLNGDIDDVAIYDKVLTRTDVVDHYNASGRTVPGSVAPSDAYGAAVYNQEPDLYWRLDEASGSTATDSGPNGTNGNIQGGVSLGRDGALKAQSRTAAGFNGSDGLVVSQNRVSNPSTYSESLWFKTTTTRGGKLIGFGDGTQGTSGNYDRHVYMQDDGRLVFGAWTGQANVITTPTSLNDGSWHQVVAMQSSDGMKLYVDGALVGTNPQTAAQPYDGYWRIGGDNTWGSSSAFFDGTLDEVAVFGKALSADTVKSLYDLGAGTAPANVKPTAAFTSSVSDLTASFDGSGSTDSDGTVASYAWTFGDADTSTAAKPDHTYASAGTYSVKLTVTDDKGLTDSVTKDVTVTAANVKPTAAFTSSVSNLAASFDGSGSTDSDGTVASYAWTFGDGGTSTAAKPDHTYASAGTYSVKLTVTDDKGLTDSVTKDVTVTAANVKPTAAFTSTVSDLKASFDGSGSTDSDGTVASYAWEFGDGGTSTAAKPERTYASAGTYSVKLTVTDDKGLTDSVTKDVTVTAAPPVTSDLAKDTFARTLASGWGNADKGGAWSLVGAASRFEVGNGAGLMKVPAGSTPGAYLPGVSSGNTDTTVNLSLDQAVTGGGIYAYVTGRGTATNAYRARVKVSANGALNLALYKVVGGTETALTSVTPSGVTYAAGDTLRIRLQVNGSGTTTVRAKIWKGSTEPTTWQTSTTDSTGALQGLSGVGLSSFVSSSATTSPLTFRYTNLIVSPVN